MFVCRTWAGVCSDAEGHSRRTELRRALPVSRDWNSTTCRRLEKTGWTNPSWKVRSIEYFAVDVIIIIIIIIITIFIERTDSSKLESEAPV